MGSYSNEIMCQETKNETEKGDYPILKFLADGSVNDKTWSYEGKKFGRFHFNIKIPNVYEGPIYYQIFIRNGILEFHYVRETELCEGRIPKCYYYKKK